MSALWPGSRSLESDLHEVSHYGQNRSAPRSWTRKLLSEQERRKVGTPRSELGVEPRPRGDSLRSPSASEPEEDLRTVLRVLPFGISMDLFYLMEVILYLIRSLNLLLASEHQARKKKKDQRYIGSRVPAKAAARHC